jgi:hypothetical protein
MPISDRLAAEALTKIREQEAEINELRKRLGISDLGSAIQKSLETPATGNGRNRLVSDIVRPALFTGRSTPVKKAEREQADADRKKQLRQELDRARGIRPFRAD